MFLYGDPSGPACNLPTRSAVGSLVELHVGGTSSAMALPQGLYRIVLRAFRALSPAMMKGGSKLARGLRGRRDAHERLAAAATALADRPVVWVHASSVGESLQARAVIDVLRGRMPGLQVVFTFFSPSAEAVRESFPADVSSCLPWDLPEVMGPVLDALQPSVIVFTQREVWPTLAEEAAARGVPTVLIAGTMPQGAGRLSGPGRILLGPAFRSLRTIAAVSKEDGDRFGLLDVRHDRVTVTGDPGIDGARDRVARADRGAPHMCVFGAGHQPAGGPILVAGSTWPSDEAVLFPALARVRLMVLDLRVILAPHEPEGYDFAELGRKLGGRMDGPPHSSARSRGPKQPVGQKEERTRFSWTALGCWPICTPWPRSPTWAGDSTGAASTLWSNQLLSGCRCSSARGTRVRFMQLGSWPPGGAVRSPMQILWPTFSRSGSRLRRKMRNAASLPWTILRIIEERPSIRPI